MPQKGRLAIVALKAIEWEPSDTTRYESQLMCTHPSIEGVPVVVEGRPELYWKCVRCRLIFKPVLGKEPEGEKK